MDVERFTNQYELAAALYRRTPEELRRRDEDGAEPVQRWLATTNGKAVGAVTAHLRPDDRLFLRFVGGDASVFGPLTEAAADSLDRPVHTMIDADDRAAVEALEAAGFQTDVEGENFRLLFESVLPLIERATVATGLRIEPADIVDEDRLFALDNTLRQDVPRTDGWRGDRKHFTTSSPKHPHSIQRPTWLRSTRRTASTLAWSGSGVTQTVLVSGCSVWLATIARLGSPPPCLNGE